MNNIIPRTFCISLKEVPNRRNRAEKYFSDIGLDVAFFDGVYGEAFGVKTSIPNTDEIPGRECHISSGHIGKILSHYSLWNILLHQPEEEFLILEDDVEFSSGFKEKLIHFKQELPEDWQFVYVGYISDSKDPIKMITDHVGIQSVLGSFAYMIKKSAIPILMETNKVLWNHLDKQIKDRSIPKLKNYVLAPSLAIHKSVCDESDSKWASLCYDWELDPLKVKNEETSEILSFGKGWHPLEKNSEGYFIWTDGRSELVINKEWTSIEIDAIVEGGVEGVCKIIRPGKTPLEINLVDGLNHLSIDLSNEKAIIFETKTFKPNQIYKSSDMRTLGMRLLKGFTLTSKYKAKFFVGLANIERVSNSAKVKVDSHENFKYTPAINTTTGKINLKNQLSFSHHRSGWNYALQTLSGEHRENAVKFDGFLDHTFGNQRELNTQLRNIPYREPWVGVFHNPPLIPNFFTDVASPTSIIFSKAFQESIPMCKGLYVLSEYHAKLLRTLIHNVPIEVLYHPTEFPSRIFNYNEFKESENKKIINIGWWLRRLTSIFRLQADRSFYQKIKLIPSVGNQSNTTIDKIMGIELACTAPLLSQELQSVINIRYMANDDYDQLLSKNIVFVDLYDSSANNVVIECMARCTPILINPLPAVVEYLGEGYPLYFNGLQEAEEKVHNIEKVKEAHQYLVDWNGREKITAEYFLKSFKKGEIYKSL